MRPCQYPVVILLLTGVAACQPVTAAPEPPPEARFERDMMLRFHMRANFDVVRAMERLLLRGKLDEARPFAEALAIAPDEPGLRRWAVHVAAVRTRAAAVAQAQTVDEALRRETQLAAACGACHRELGVTAFEKPPAPPEDQPTTAARMARHRWAADRLWEGVVGGAEDAWRDGLDMLARAPLDLGPERAPYARELRRLANTARRSDPLVDRASAYGDILVTCAGCHAVQR